MSRTHLIERRCKSYDGTGDRYNGYVGVDKDHPLYGVDYTESCIKYDSDTREIMAYHSTVECSFEAHGGITYAGDRIQDEYFKDELWYFGWDSFHYGDRSEDWQAERAREENLSLQEQLETYEALIKETIPFEYYFYEGIMRKRVSDKTNYTPEQLETYSKLWKLALSGDEGFIKLAEEYINGFHSNS